MRRFLFGVAIASMTAVMPAWAFGGDREIAKTLMTELQQHKAAGQLKGFDIDLKVEDGIVFLTGRVASVAQHKLVLKAAGTAAGAENVVDELSIDGAQDYSAVEPASTTAPINRDMQITDAVIDRLQKAKSAGTLRGFELDVSTVNGDVWLKGSVANSAQKSHVLDLARRVDGVARVIDDVTIKDASVRPVSNSEPTPALMPVPLPQVSVPQVSEPQFLGQQLHEPQFHGQQFHGQQFHGQQVRGQQVSSMPMVGTAAPATPRAFAPSGFASAHMGGGHAVATPVPMNGAGLEYGVGAPRYDQPNMPSYAWPSYAAYPNYAAVTYPKQYSPSAWPYIGPFYPYPQVPLGWRKVTLEWDDGLWYLDFTSK
jgi:osmotically-inducible protein OsmY